MKKFIIPAVLALFLTPLYAAEYNIKTDPVLKTMEAEIKRSMAKLKKAAPPIYFLSYQITDSVIYNLFSVLGALSFENTSQKRYLDVEVRAGSREMDNTRKIKELSFDNMMARNRSAQQTAPLEDNIENLRKALWLATESAVKKAQEDFLKVKTNSQTASERSDNSPDFSAPLKPQSYYAAVGPAVFDRSAVLEKINALSALFKGYDFILYSEVSLSMRTDNVFYVNSEGTKLRNPANFIRLSYSLSTRNQDGMELDRTNSYDFKDIKDMPSFETIAKDIAISIEELRILQNAPMAEPYHGPAILMNKATGVFFHEILGHRVEGHRQKDDDFGQTFTQKLNQQIISPIISVYDNPLLKEYKGIPMRGHYLYDDEGVPAENVTIVKDGVLKGFLMSRSPVKGFPQSNAHGRKAPGKSVVARMGNTIVEAKNPVTFEELRKLLIEEIKKQGKEYGLLIKDISGGYTNTDTYGPQSFKVKPLLVYRVYPDGRPDEIIRGADIVGTPLSSFNKIIAAADDDDVFNGSCGAESGWVPVSAIAPSILISELEIEKVEKTYDALPLLPPPSAEKTALKTKTPKAKKEVK